MSCQQAEQPWLESVLLAEHRTIGMLLRCIEAACATCEGGGQPPIERLKSVVEILGDYASRYHHAKEEMLFALLRRSAKGEMESFVRVLDNEHDELDGCFATLDLAVRQMAAGTDGHAFVPQARRVCELLGWHMRCEEEKLIPRLRSLLSPEDLNVVKEWMESTDRHLGRERKQRLEEETLVLAREFGVLREAPVG
ncbi:MAG: hemerythrin domain-containing protein [Candidatus Wallbacteria bacterium]|nr:hemerythrin domain-containing protein [Candidatus Wallbacteria bacterium]